MKSNLTNNSITKKLKIKDKITIIQKLFSTLNNLHWNKYIHGNIKPTNILIDNKNNPYLVDFLEGFKIHNSCHSPKKNNYFSPPEYYNNNPLTDKSDNWSLALSIYHFIFKI